MVSEGSERCVSFKLNKERNGSVNEARFFALILCFNLTKHSEKGERNEMKQREIVLRSSLSLHYISLCSIRSFFLFPLYSISCKEKIKGNKQR